MKISKDHKKLKEAVVIKEEFMPYCTKPLDSKYRITLGNMLMKVMSRHLKADSYQIFVGAQGDILLRPAVSIPSREAWVYRNPRAIEKIRKGLQEAAQGKTERVGDLDSFLAEGLKRRKNI